MNNAEKDCVLSMNNAEKDCVPAMDDNDKKRVLSMFALARKAGKLSSGNTNALAAIRSSTAYLLHISTDASANTQKKFCDKATFYKVPICSIFSKEEISAHIGLENAATMVITDDGFAKKLKEMMLQEKDSKIQA